MGKNAISVASSHLDEALKIGKGQRFVADPHEQTTAAGDTVVRFAREYRGIPLFLYGVSVHVTADNRIARTTGAMDGSMWTCDVVPDISAAAGVQYAIAHFRSRLGTGERPCRMPHRVLLARCTIDPQPLASFPIPSRPTVFATRRGGIAAHLVILVEGRTPQLCWLVRLPTGLTGEYLNVVAATGDRKGEVLFCAPWSASAHCSASVFRSSPDAVGSNRQQVDFPLPLGAYPPGFSVNPNAKLFADWMDGASMIGNCVEMFLANAPKTLKATQTPQGLQLPQASDPFGLDQGLVNTFFLCNYLHDFFLLLGFGEKEGNFQLVNSSGSGRDGDRLRVRVFDAVIQNLGIMQARDDGTTAELRVGRSPAKRLAALDADIVIHEYGHGVSHRLVGGRLGWSSLIEEQSIGVDEGWSDYFAITIQNAFRPNAEVFTFGEWVSGKAGGLRLAPYDANYTGHYGMLGKKPYNTTIAAAEVWAVALIRMNEAIGADLNSKMRGHEIGWSAVVESMKLLEDDNPTFVQARGAVLAAIDGLHKGGAITAAEHGTAVPAALRAFRERGLGAQASSSGTSLKDARADFT
jgi:extracellular elastinolytic metalloproteinase